MPKGYNCTLTSGIGSITIGGYSKNGNGNNNCLSPYSTISGLPAGSSISISGSGNGETMTINLTGITANTSLNLIIYVDANNDNGTCT